MTDSADGDNEVKVLVAAASKYGATAEIAQAIGKALADPGLDVGYEPLGSRRAGRTGDRRGVI
jgi:menaquinone-dependent protoporphyrinogen IX oxidase